MVSKRDHFYADIPAGLEDWVANRLVSAHFRILKALILGHLLNTALVIAVFYNDVSSNMLGIWTGAMVATCAHRYWIGQTNHKRVARKTPNAVIFELEINTVMLALLAASAISWFMPRAESGLNQVFLAVIGTTLIAAAGYTMRTLPRAALSYIAIISTGLILALLRTGSIEAIATCILIGASGILLGRMALVAHGLFIVRILREREAHATSETVRMLLHDYQDQGSDWLFELDRNGHLLSVGDRFADAVGKRPEDLNGRDFSAFFEDTRDQATLIDHLQNRRAFRDLILPLADQSSGTRNWWSVSGRPANGGPTSAVHFRGVISDISAEKQAEARVRYMAHYDSLTELPNRMMFSVALNRMFSELQGKVRLVVLLIDVDHFKAVNDIYGHPVGDSFLKQVGARIASGMKNSGLGGEGHIVARLGGDEFAVLMAGEDAVDHALRLAQNLTDALAAPYHINGHEINSGASIGIAMAPEHGATAQTLQNNADIALYYAKDNGRNRWELFEPGMDVAVQERHALERDLRSALVQDELRLYFQPLVNVETGLHTGFEALIRWEHPMRGMVMPNDFIPIAEESGLIIPIGEWVIRTAMREAATWRDPHTIAVNLSPVQLKSTNLLPTIINTLAETGLDPARLEVEITESVLLNDCEANISILNRLHDLGIKIALDDFGTGYASLNYLRTFPFDKIKIDRSFVTDLENREDCRAIVSAVINLANKLGMCTLAEGVESEAQLNALRSEGCAMVQGWLFGKAMPAEHYTGLRDLPALPNPVSSVKKIRQTPLRTEPKSKAA